MDGNASSVAEKSTACGLKMRISGPFMKFPQLHLLAVLCLASCAALIKTLPTAPDPAEFKLSPEELSEKAKATRSLGIVDLYADSIRSSQDEKGNDVHLATGNVLLVKRTSTPVHAKAEEILLNADHAEVRGLAIVKIGEELHYGDAAESKIIIDGVQLRFEGPHSLKRLSNEPPKPEPAPAEEIKPEPVAEAPAAPTAPAPEIKPEPKPEPKPTPKPVAKPQAPKTTAKSKPKAVPKPTPAKPVATKPTTPAPKPAAPTIDRSKLLQLMREPEN